MSLLAWNSSFLLGIQEVDQQHRQLVALVRKVFDEFKGEAPVPTLMSSLQALLDHARYHFAFEEHWMNETSFPDIAEHKKEHETFENALVEIRKLTEQSLNESLEPLLYISNWVSHHIMETDARLAKHIVESNKWAGEITASNLPVHILIQKYLSS